MERYSKDRFEVCNYCGTQNPISRTYCYECSEFLSLPTFIHRREPTAKEKTMKADRIKQDNPILEQTNSKDNKEDNSKDNIDQNEYKPMIYALSYNILKF